MKYCYAIKVCIRYYKIFILFFKESRKNKCEVFDVVQKFLLY